MSGRSSSPRATSGRIPVTAIVLTRDEEVNIARCLRCLDPVDDVIVVDSESTDATLRMATEARSDVRIFTHAFQDFGDQRNWALENTSPKHGWVLFVDADEFCTDELLDEIYDFLKAPGSHAGAFISGKNYFLNRWLKRTTLYPTPQLRLLRVGSVIFRKHGHGQREVSNGPFRTLAQSWRHEPFNKGVHEWVERHNHYSTEEVELLLAMRQQPIPWSEIFGPDPLKRKRAIKILSAKIPLRPFASFLYLYFIKRGFLDGYPGFLYAALIMAHHIHILAKCRERNVCGPRQRSAAGDEYSIGC
jgi:glycosyltransferase involved in cell wall biosynthesis